MLALKRCILPEQSTGAGQAGIRCRLTEMVVVSDEGKGRISGLIEPLGRPFVSRRKLSKLEAQGITRPCPAREIIITDAISKAEEIMRKIEKNYPAK